MTDPRELEPDPPDYEPGMDDDWEALLDDDADGDQ